MAGSRPRPGGSWADDKDDGDGPCREQLQSLGSIEKKTRPCAGHGRNLRLAEAPELLWIFLVGFGDAVGLGESHMFGGICCGAVEVFQEEN